MAAGKELSPGHAERHFTLNEHLRDVIIGMSDGLTVPFALAAGIAGAGAHTGLILTAGLAEIAAGSISMGLGGYLAAKSDADHYHNEWRREEREVEEKPDAERREVEEILTNYGLTPAESAPVVDALSRRKHDWIEFMMRFELGLEKPEANRAIISALTIAFAYILGGLIPLAPYMLTADPIRGLLTSVAVTGLALALFGYLRGRFATAQPLKTTLQTILIGGLAAAVAFFVARIL